MIYVNMTDSFFSGWGKAHGGKNFFCIACEDYRQAEAIEKAANDRPEMKRVTISDKPRKRQSSRDYVSITAFANLGDSWKKYYREPQKVQS